MGRGVVKVEVEGWQNSMILVLPITNIFDTKYACNLAFTLYRISIPLLILSKKSIQIACLCGLLAKN